MLATTSLIFLGLFVWSMMKARNAVRALVAARAELVIADSLALEAEDAQWYAERERDKSDGVLEDLKRLFPELERKTEEILIEKNVALANAVEARKQERGKQVALEGERSARLDEEAQRKIAEAKTDSLTQAKRKTDNLNLQQRASVLAQNSTTTKGRPEFRAMMAVLALRSMERSGGDVNKIEVVRALQGALEELERPDPARVTGFKRPPHQLSSMGEVHPILALGHDGILYSVDRNTMRKSTILDLSKEIEPLSGRSFLSSDNSSTILVDQQGNLSAYRIPDGELIAKSNASGSSAGVRAVVSWPGMNTIVTGDAKGNVQPWRKVGNKFEPMTPHRMPAAVKGMVYDAGTDHVVIVAGKGPVVILDEQGAFVELPLPAGQHARCISTAGKGFVVIGTEQGAVFRVDLKKRQVTTLEPSGGRMIETITARQDRLVYVNAVKELVVIEGVDNAPKLRLALDAVPSALLLGPDDELYLAYHDRMERAYCTSRSMANKACELIGRTWTVAEWKEIGGIGTPEDPCAGF